MSILMNRIHCYSCNTRISQFGINKVSIYILKYNIQFIHTKRGKSHLKVTVVSTIIYYTSKLGDGVVDTGDGVVDTLP